MHWLACRTSDFSQEDYDRAYRLLSPSRKAHIDRFRRQADRIRSLSGELLVQKLLEYYGISGAVLHRGPNGQPFLSGCQLKVSISHCADMVACAVSEQDVGIDIEQIRPIDLSAVRHVCVEEELQYLLGGAAMPEDRRPCEDQNILLRFYEIWTAKEAYFKKQGTGITGLKSVNILTLDRQVFQKEDYMIQIL